MCTYVLHYIPEREPREVLFVLIGNFFMTKKITPSNETLSGRLQIIRGSTTQEKFAKMLGVGRTSLIRYESGERVPDATFLQAVVTKCKVDPSWLLLGIEDVPKKEHLNREKQALLDAYDEMTPRQRASLLEVSRVFTQPDTDTEAG